MGLRLPRDICYILLRRSILESIGGWVLNRPESFFLKGSLMNKGATALLYLFVSWLEISSFFIFCKADLRPSGYLVNLTPVASAVNSLFLEIAN